MGIVYGLASNLPKRWEISPFKHILFDSLRGMPFSSIGCTKPLQDKCYNRRLLYVQQQAVYRLSRTLFLLRKTVDSQPKVLHMLNIPPFQIDNCSHSKLLCRNSTNHPKDEYSVVHSH